MNRVLPVVDDVNRPFWDGCRDGVLRLQRCECGHLRYPVASLCPRCLSTEATWEDVSGSGEVYSFAVFRHAYNEAWKDRIPYAVALVRLDEGPIVIADIIVEDPAEVRVGMAVGVVFEHVADEIAIPAFAPSGLS